MKSNVTSHSLGTAGTLHAGGSSARDDAIAWAMGHEGGFIDHPSDPGGATNFGVSLRYARATGQLRGTAGQLILDLDLDNDGDIDADDIRKMTSEQAALVYVDIWNRFKFDVVIDRRIAAKFFDLSLPMGYGGASRVIQRAMRACRYDVVEDGYVGPKSRAAINAAIEWNNIAVMTSLCAEAAGYFRDLDAPAFEEGWLNRAYHWPFRN